MPADSSTLTASWRPRLIVVALFAGLALLRGCGVMFPVQWERGLHDLAVRNTLPAPDAADDIVVIEVDDRTLQRLRERWPLPREVWADFLDRLAQFDPAVIAVDAVFDQPSSGADLELAHELLERLPPDDVATRTWLEAQLGPRDADRHLSSSISSAGTVILGAMLSPRRDPLSEARDTNAIQALQGVAADDLSYGYEEVIQSTPEIAVAARSHGLLNQRVDDDGRLRRYIYAGRSGDAAYPSLALAAVIAAEPERAAELTERATRYDGGIPILRLHPPRELDHLSFLDVMLATDESAGVRAHLEGRIVFVGVTATGVPEQIITPLGTDTTGVEIHAMAADGLRRGTIAHTSGAAALLGSALSLILLLGLAFAAARWRLNLLAAATAAVVVGYAALWHVLYLSPGWVLPIVPVTIGAIALLATEATMRLRLLGIERHELLLQQRFADEKTRFIADVTHELRTPLTSIRGSLGLVVAGVSGEVDADAREMIEIAHDNTERLIRLVNDVLELEKLTDKSMRLELRPGVSVASLIDTTIEANRAIADELGISVARDVADGLTIHADRDRMIQVLTNLLSNAIKFSPRGNEVHIAATERDREVVISVRDEGAGIPEEFRDNVFERFSRAIADASGPPGTGLGLSIVRAIVTGHHGRVWFETETGAGTTFFVALPSSSTAAVTTPSDPPSTAR